MTWKRTLIILGYIGLAGYLASIESKDALAILSAVGTPIGMYVAIKGNGKPV